MKFVVVGGGMTGWISTFVLATRYPDISFLVLDSSNIPTIGVGEGTTGYFLNAVIREPGKFTLKEFIKETKATPKLAIEFEDWDYIGHKYLNPIDSSVTKRLNYDYSTVFDYTQSVNTDYIFGEKSSVLCNLRKKNLTPFYKNNDNLDYYDTALHLDNKLTIDFLKKQSLKLPNVECIDTTVWKINRDKNGIKELICSDGLPVKGDIYLDCTGFKRILSQDVKWKSFSNELLLNSVMTFQTNHDGNPDLVTKAKAEKYGWMWSIPTQDRYGNGYLFSDKHVDATEISNYVRRNYAIDNLGGIFKFDPGKLVSSWNNNVVALGLSYHFLEPLQATSIHLTLTQLDLIGKYCIKPSIKSTLDKENIKKYNTHIDKVIENYKDFISLHYSGKRDDSTFWKKLSKKNHLSKFTKNIIKNTKERGLFDTDFPDIIGTTGRELWHYTILGMNHVSLNECFNQLMQYNALQEANNIIIQNDIECNPDSFMNYQEFIEKVNS